MPHPDVAVVSSLYHSQDHYALFVPSVIEQLRDLAHLGISCEHVFVINEATEQDRSAIQEIREAVEGISGISVCVLEVPRESLYASWNRGIRASSAPVVGFWNADDVRSARGVEEGLSLVRQGAQLVFFEWISQLAQSEENPDLIRMSKIDLPPFDPFIYSRLMLFGPFFLFTRDLFERVGPFDEQLKVVGDMDWSVRAIQTTNQIVKASSAGGVFRDAGSGLSTSNRQRLLREQRWIRIRYDQKDFLSPWTQESSDDFRVDAALDSTTHEQWFPIPLIQRKPIIPTDESIRFFRNRGRLRYRLWTRVLWTLFPRYNLTKLRKQLLKAHGHHL